MIDENELIAKLLRHILNDTSGTTIYDMRMILEDGEDPEGYEAIVFQPDASLIPVDEMCHDTFIIISFTEQLNPNEKVTTVTVLGETDDKPVRHASDVLLGYPEQLFSTDSTNGGFTEVSELFDQIFIQLHTREASEQDARRTGTLKLFSNL